MLHLIQIYSKKIHCQLDSFKSFLCSCFWNEGRRRTMKYILCVMCLVVFIQLVLLCSNSIDTLKKKPQYETSLFTMVLLLLTTILSAIYFGPPVSPALISLISLAFMFCIKPFLPGLIPHIEQLTISFISLGLCIEYLVNGSTFGESPDQKTS